jgi:hypothetical protein
MVNVRNELCWGVLWCPVAGPLVTMKVNRPVESELKPLFAVLFLKSLHNEQHAPLTRAVPELLLDGTEINAVQLGSFYTKLVASRSNTTVSAAVLGLLRA